MFDLTSRYQKLDNASITETDATGAVHIHVYKRRRFLPQLKAQTTLTVVALSDGDRLDNLAAQVTGDSTQFWRICDANLVKDPSELLSPPGRRIRIAMSSF
jgi:hypothetical protein